MNSEAQNPMRELDWIRKSFPAEILVHVGVGRGSGDMHQWQCWGISRAVLIEPLIKPDSAMQIRLRDNPGWQWFNEVLSDKDDEADFFKASNPQESGLLDPASLQSVWPNLRVLESHPVTTRRLDSLLDELQCDDRMDWLIVDCLPALTILRGAGDRLIDCQVVWVRGILDNSRLNLLGASLTEIEDYLKPLCFRRAAEFEGLHPAIGEAIFVRDWPRYVQMRTKEFCLAHEQENETCQNVKASLLSECDALKLRMNEMAVARDALVQDLTDVVGVRDQLARQATELQQHLEAACQDNAQLASSRDALARERLALTHACGAETKAKADALARIVVLEQAMQELIASRDVLALEKVTLTQTLDAEEQAKAEALAQRDAATKANADAQTRIKALEQVQQELTAARDALAQENTALTQAWDAEAKTKAEALAQQQALAKEKADLGNTLAETQKSVEKLRADISERESDLAECRHRQQLMNDELLKAEAQIELIKDLLLREPGL